MIHLQFFISGFNIKILHFFILQKSKPLWCSLFYRSSISRTSSVYITRIIFLPLNSFLNSSLSR